MRKTGFRICLAYLLSLGSPFGALAGVTPELQHAIRENTFEVVTNRHIDEARSQVLKKYADTIFPKGAGSEALLEFVPAGPNGKPVESKAAIPIVFKLQE